jgi:uncharacterized DUF497 family protein
LYGNLCHTTPNVGFEWDSGKDLLNRRKHGVGFERAQHAFLDPNRVIAEDLGHSAKNRGTSASVFVDSSVLTVRFTFRGERISHYRRRLLAER